MIDDIKAPPGGGRPTQRGVRRPEGDIVMAGEDIDTAAIEATGVTPASTDESSEERLVVDPADLGEDSGSSTDGSEKLVVTKEDLEDTDSTSELGGTAVGDTLGDLLTSDSDGGSGEDDGSDSSVSETVIKDKDMAVEMAYAEKPFQDAKVKEREPGEELSDTDKEMLEFFASEAAEEAMTKYTEAKSQMSEAEAVLLEKAEPFGVLREKYELTDDDFAERSFKVYERNPERRATKLKIAEKNLKTVVDMQVEAVMDNPDLSPAEKLKFIQAIADTRNVARDSLVHSGGGRSGNIYPDDVKELIQWGGGREEDKIPRLWGRVVAALANDQGNVAVQAIEMIANLSAAEFGEVFEQVAPMIAESTKNSGNKEFTNNYLERLGYIWSDRLDKYVKYDMS